MHVDVVEPPTRKKVSFCHEYTCPEDCQECEPGEKKDEKGVNEINVKGMWEVIPVKLDSGAFDWVFNPKSAQAFKLEETESSKAGLNFTAANCLFPF